MTSKPLGGSERLYNANLGQKDIQQVRKTFADLMKMHDKAGTAAGQKLPEDLEALFTRKRVPVVELLKTLNNVLKDSSGVADSMKSSLATLKGQFEPDTEGAQQAPVEGSQQAALADSKQGTPGETKDGAREAAALKGPFEPDAEGAQQAPVEGSQQAARADSKQATPGETAKGPLEDRIAKAKLGRINSREDIERFFRPMLETARLRDQVVLTSGGTLGVGIPFIGVSPAFPLSASADLYSRRTDAFLQFKNPTFASEIVVGSTVTDMHDARVTMGKRWEFGAGDSGSVSMGGDVRLDMSRAKTVQTTLRTKRDKDSDGNRQVQKAIDDNLNVLDILLTWDKEKDETGKPKFAGPLEAIFARSPDTLVASSEKKDSTVQIAAEARATLRGRTPNHKFSGGLTWAPLSVRLGRIRESNTERTGFEHQRVEDRNETAGLRITSAFRANFGATAFRHTFTSHDGTKDTGRARVPFTGNLWERTQELFSTIEKNGATRFPIGDTVGESVDRVYTTPKDLLAEIEHNRDDWLVRCLDVLPRPKGAETDTPERLQEAMELLDRFEKNLRDAGSDPSFQFNIKYEMQPRMSGMIDGLRGLEALARDRGDAAAAEQARDAMMDLLSNRASWAPKNMTVRSKGTNAQSWGIDFLLRWQKSASADTSRVALAYPV